MGKFWVMFKKHSENRHSSTYLKSTFEKRPFLMVTNWATLIVSNWATLVQL